MGGGILSGGKMIHTVVLCRLDMHVDDVDPSGIMKISTLFSHLLAKTNMGTGADSISFDTDKPDTSTQAGKIISALKNQKISMMVSSEGKIISFKGMDSLIQAMKETDGTTDGQRAILQKVLGDSSLITLTGSVFNLYPNKVVTEGDVWTIAQNTQTGILPMVTKTTYKVKSITAKSIVLKVDSKIESAAKLSGIENLGVKLSVEGNQDGEIEVDKATGQIIRYHTDESIKAKMSMSGGKNAGMEIPVEMKGSMTVIPQ